MVLDNEEDLLHLIFLVFELRNDVLNWEDGPSDELEVAVEALHLDLVFVLHDHRVELGPLHALVNS